MGIAGKESLVVRHLKDVSELAGFRCGVARMDDFIQKHLSSSIENHYCQAYVVRRGGQVVAMFALGFDSLALDDDSLEEMLLGQSANMPDITGEYQDTFFAKFHYPAVEISYIAIDQRYQKEGIGSALIDGIEDMVRRQNVAGCMFLTVEAYKTEDYSAIGFYNKCGFEAGEMLNANKSTLRMFKALYQNRN
ncbi:MAG: GNAT family N-acetyltransferase [Bacteroidales bacterium]|nr:GNAT family N-acetyltransferase [Bacteroidales bacterium]